MTTPLSIAAFFDGRPGHEKQTRGILQAMERITPVTVFPVHVEVGLRPAACAWLSLLVHLPWDTTLLPGLPGADVDLLLGTGSRTHVPMLLARRRFPAARLAACMAPLPPLACRFDVLFVPRHDRLPPAANLVETLGPPNTATAARRSGPERGLLLVGGVDEKSHHWRTAELLPQVRAVAERHRIPWTIATSRRTPAETEVALAALARELPDLRIVPARDTGPGWIEEQYRESALVWVTADSVSMVYEALTAGCRVGVLPVAWKQADNKFQRGLAWLRQQQMVVFFDDWLAGAPLSEAPLLDEAGRCARELLHRFWPERFGLERGRHG